MPDSFSTEIIKKRGKARHRRCQRCRRDGDRLRLEEVGLCGAFSSARRRRRSHRRPHIECYRSSREAAQGDEDAALSSDGQQNDARRYVAKAGTMMGIFERGGFQ